ncbi:YcjF family protein [Vibrio cyclitrophicus]|uniref:YcjF family protein n=1 Tax=Vibrio cyclitrophicus TaxID=47951 RepID=UPI000C85E907|nr:GTPase [Vibrio cyclitrophicus]PME23719.1 kinase [Vibrio cyclitrophicus]PMF51042.1 kinase [Vibrio cyclitrophicus]PMH47808.1 kinase [Vibrio cyclitrophicus]PMI67539.1 kinase [Vibrio cyclitrophicus]PMK83614.1 kinase [Vibrio cyclitrophicus]
MFDQIKDFINPSKNPDLTQAQEYQRKHLPTLWLLGKTGAGKSSFIQAVTGNSSVEVGNGFAPCTMTAMSYEFPQDKPVMRFLDTRGLGEADYDPKDDLEEIGQAGNALVVVMKADEPEQSSVLSALKQVKKQKKIEHLLLVHTAVLSSNETDRTRQIRFNTNQVEKVWGKDCSSVAVDFETDDGSTYNSSPIYNYDTLIEQLTTILPVIGMMVIDKEHSTQEEANFDQVENEVLWYAGSAAASDLIPGVGLVSVPAIQAKMLHSLANQYGVEWNKRVFSELIGTLGSSFALQYGMKLGTRQLIKLIPVYGQTVGAVAAAAMSFGTSYGLGRAACFYFYHKNKGEEVSEQEMQKIYKESLKKGKAASGYEEN